MRRSYFPHIARIDAEKKSAEICEICGIFFFLGAHADGRRKIQRDVKELFPADRAD
jgi:hypothetical protein